MRRVMSVILILGIAVTVGLGGVASADECAVSEVKNSEVEQITETNSNVEYNIKINKKYDCVTVDIYKRDSATWPIRLFLYVDGQEVEHAEPELDPSDSWSSEWQFDKKYDITKDVNSVRVETSGPDIETKIKNEFNLSDPDIPVQQITDVNLVEATNDNGERIAKAVVTFENPSPHAYMGEVFAHTRATHGSGDSALVPIGEKTGTSKIELEDDPDSTIEGEIRYATEGIDKDEGVREQVWFRGEVGGDVTVQHQEFEPVAYPTENDAYQYDDESSPVTLPPAEYIAAGIGFGLLLLFGIARQYWK